jgi:hypothetical protein
LEAALARNCTCKYGDANERTETCAPHAALADQRWLDGLLFARRINSRLHKEEWALPVTRRDNGRDRAA